jgi:hypothetical protein
MSCPNSPDTTRRSKEAADREQGEKLPEPANSELPTASDGCQDEQSGNNIVDSVSLFC